MWKYFQYTHRLFQVTILYFLIHAPTNVQASPVNAQELKSLLNATQNATNALKTSVPTARIIERGSQRTPRLALHLNLPLPGETVQERAQAFIHRFQGLWYHVDVQVTDVSQSKGRQVAHLKGKVNGLTVLNGDARLTFNDQGLLLNMSNGLPPVATFTPALLEESQAIAKLKAGLALNTDVSLTVDRGVVAIEDQAIEVFVTRVALDPKKPMEFWIDGRDGSILRQKEGGLR